MSAFLIIFFIIYGGMHIYAFCNARGAFSFGYAAAVPLALFMLLMVFAPILIRFLERGDYEVQARLLALFSYSWMGALLLFVSISLLIDTYRLFLFLAANTLKSDLAPLSPSGYISFFLPLGLSLLIAVYGIFEAKYIRIERITVKSSKMPKEVGSIKIAQISDLHAGLITREGRVKRVLDLIKSEEPDILVSTGDLVDGQYTAVDGISELFLEVRPRYGKYAVTGNHEYYAGLDHTLEFTRSAGFVVLRGAGATVAGIINIAGVDDIQGKAFDNYREVDEGELLSGLPDDRFTILLKHRPVVDERSIGLFDLQLSGHTHGGQIFPFGLAVRYFYPHIAGMAELSEGSKIYSSRGTGTWGPPIRFLSPPEITLFEISNEE